MPEEGRATAADSVAARLLALPEVAGARRVFACLSFADELDSWELVARLERLGKELFVPRAERGETALHVHRYPCELATLGFGLVQPSRRAPELAPEAIDSTLDVALVAGVGFDLAGHRLGYGAGYFDRFLAGRPFAAIGFGFDLQVVDRLPVEPHDIRLAAVVTETRTIRP